MSQLILGGALFAVACILTPLSVLCFLWLATQENPHYQVTSGYAESVEAFVVVPLRETSLVVPFSMHATARNVVF